MAAIATHVIAVTYFYFCDMYTRFFCIVVMCLTSVGLFAQEAADTTIIGRIEQGGRIDISYPDGLLQRIAPVLPQSDEEPTESTPTTIANTTRVGYRVLVFDDNNVNTAKHQAQARSQQIKSRFPEWNSYIQFNSPYWRVKVGDFKTRSEAEAAMAAIRAAFPGISSQLRVVRDRINH